MKTKQLVTIAVACLFPALAFAQMPSPPTPPAPATAPNAPLPPKPDRDHDDPTPKVAVTFLGVETSGVPSVVSEQLGLPKGFGLVVDYVTKDGPAAQAGVQKNDIIRLLNDQIVMEPDQLAKLVRSFAEGTSVTLTILRKGAESKITVKLGKKEVSARRFGRNHRDGPRDLMDPMDHEFKFEGDFGHFDNALEKLENIEVPRAPDLRDTIERAREQVMRVREDAQRAREDARRVREDQRGLLRQQLSVKSKDGDTMRTTRIDLDKAQILYSDDKGELKIEKVGGKKTLTAKDPQGKVLFNGPVETTEERDKLPAEVRQRFEKLENNDIPAAIPPVPPVPAVPDSLDTVSLKTGLRASTAGLQQVCLNKRSAGRLWPARTMML